MPLCIGLSGCNEMTSLPRSCDLAFEIIRIASSSPPEKTVSSKQRHQVRDFHWSHLNDLDASVTGGLLQYLQ